MSSHASLNHIYRTVWNQALGVMVAVAEIVSGRGRGSATASRRQPSLAAPPQSTTFLTALSLGIAIAWGCIPSSALANPGGGVAIVGQASLVNQGNKLTVTTQNGAGGNYSAINWQSFSIPLGSTTYFQQPNATSTSINRVVTNTPSLLFGTLGSNGKLVLVNQSGIAVGAGAVVDTAGFTASSLRMSDADALAGRLLFGDGLASGAAVSVQGRILARSGDVVLLGSSIETGKEALIQAPNGSTILAAGQQIELTGRGLEGISLQVQAPANQAVNLGTLKGDAVAIFAGTLKHSGLIQATTASLEGGKVVLKASGDAYVEGSGKIVASGSVGGSVDVLGQRVALTDQAQIDVSGEKGGGTVRVGGDYQGKNPEVQNASMSYFGQQTSIKADATGSGDGGKVIVWADDTTRAYGSISATGGATGGNGGLVETSGKRALEVTGIRVDASAPQGNRGLWLLDPSDITVTHGAAGAFVDGAGLFNPTTSPSSIGDSEISAPLNSGTNVTLQTSGGITGTGTGAIVVNGSADSGGAAVITHNIGLGTRTLTLSTLGTINIHSGANINGLGAYTLNVALNGASGNTIAGMIDNKGGTTTLTGATTLSSSGTIKRGTLTSADTLTSSSGTLDAVTLGGTLSFGGSGNTFINNGITLAAGAVVNKGASNWYFGTTGVTQHIASTGTGTINSAGGALYAGWGVANQTLQIDSGITYQGYGNIADSSAASIINAGTLASNTAGQTLTISPTNFSNAASGIVSTGATVTTLTIAPTNATAPNWSNAGIIQTGVGSTVNLGGSFTTAGLGTITPVAGRLVNVTGILDNTGSTLNLDGTGQFGTGGLTTLTGTIKNGTLSSTTATLTSSSGKLDGVTLSGTLSFGGSGNTFINNGITLAAGAVVNKGVGNWYFGSAGTQHIAGTGTINSAGGALYAGWGVPNQTLQIDSGITYQGYGNISDSSAASIINAGTLASNTAAQTLSISPGNFSNTASGVLNAAAGTLTLNPSNATAPNWSNANTGGLQVGASGTLNLGGSFTTASLGTIAHTAGGVVNLTGILDNTAATLNLDNAGQFGTGGLSTLTGTIKNGTLSSTAATLTSSSGKLDGVTLSGTLSFGGSGNTFINNGITLAAGAVVNKGVGNWYFGSAGTQHIASTGTGTINNAGGALYAGWGVSNQTLQIDSGITYQGYGNISDSSAASIINAGTLASNTAAQTLTISPGNFSNTASGVLNAAAGTLTLNPNNATAPNWSNANTGGLQVGASGTLNLGGSFTTASLGTIAHMAGGVVNLTGILDNSANLSALDLGSAGRFGTGGLSSLSGTIKGGTLISSDATTPTLNSSYGTLDAVVLGDSIHSTLTTSGNFYINNGLTLANAMTVNKGSGTWYLGGASLQHIGVLGTTGSAATLNNAGGYLYAGYTSGGSLQIDTGVTVQGYGGFYNYSTAGLTNNGSIIANTAGQTFTISNNTLTNNGTLSATAGTLTLSPTTFSNTSGSTISVNGGTVNINPANSTAWSNMGSISVSAATGSTLNLGGLFTTAGLGTLTRSGGALNITGTLDNSANLSALDIGSAGRFGTGGLSSLSGTIKGGTLISSDATTPTLNSGYGTLDGVILGDSTHSTLTTSGNFYINNGLTLANAMTLNKGSGTWYLGGASVQHIGVLGTTGSAATLNNAGGYLYAGYTSGGSLQIDTGVTVQGYGSFYNYGTAGLINNGSIIANTAGQTFTISNNTLTNNGTLSATAGTLTINPTTFSNTSGSTISVNGGTVNINPANSTAWSNMGSISVSAATGSILNLGGLFTTAGLGTLTRSGGALNITGTMDNSANLSALDIGNAGRFGTGGLSNLSGTIKGGTLISSDATTPTLNSYYGTLDAVVLGDPGHGTLTTSGNFYINNGLTLANAMTLNKGNGTWYFGGASLQHIGVQTNAQAGVGSATVNDAGGYFYAGYSLGGSLQIDAGVTVQGYGGFYNYNTAGLINAGSIIANTANQTFTISNNTLTNNGTLSATAGTLTLSPTTFSNSAGANVSASSASILNITPNSINNAGTMTLGGASHTIGTNYYNSTSASYTYTDLTNTGSIALSGGSLDLKLAATSASLASNLGAMFSSRAVGTTVNFGGTLDNSAVGSILDVGSAGLFGTGGLNTLSGTIKGGRLISSDATTPTLTSNYGTLDAVVLGDSTHGTLTTSGNFYINNGLTLANAMSVNKGSGTWYFGGTGTQHLGVQANAQAGVGSATLNNAGGTLWAGYTSGGTLQIDSGVTVQGYGSFYNNYTATITNNGSITANTAGQTFTISNNTLTNNGTLSATAGTLTLSPTTFSNSAGANVTASTGATLYLTPNSINNAGTMTLGGASHTIGTNYYNSTSASYTYTDLTNTGSIALSGGSLDLKLAATSASLASNLGAMFSSRAVGTTVNFGGTLDNSAVGSILDVGSAGLFGTGGLNTLSGTIKGGRLISSDATTPTLTSNYGTLDAVVLGDSTHGTLTTSGSFYINNGLTLANAMTVNKGSGTWYFGGATLQHIGVLANAQAGVGTATLNDAGGNLYAGYTSGGTLQIDSGVTVQGYGGLYNNYASTITNNGSIIANTTGQTFTVQPSSLVNNGTLSATAGTLNASATTFTNNGTINLASSGTFARSGGFTNPVGGVIQGNGFINLSTGTLINQGAINPGGLAGIGQLNITGNLTNSGNVNIDIGGLVPSTQHDKLMVSGTATLGGNLNVSNLGSYVPGATDSFNVLGAGTISGTFATVSTPTGSAYAPQYSSALAWLSWSTSALPSSINAWLPDADGNWNVASNWTNLALPTASNSVVIDRPNGVYNVTASYGTLLAGSLMSNENLLVSGGSLNLGAASSVNSLSVSGGTLTANAGLTATNYSQTAGTLNIGGTTLLKSTGSMTVSGAIASTTGGTLTLQAVNNISLATGGSIGATAAPLNVILNANSTNAGGSISLASGTSISSNGGNISLGGGAGGISAGVGFAQGSRGVAVGGNLSAAGGNIVINGKADTANATPVGVEISGATVSTTGTGTITLTGQYLNAGGVGGITVGTASQAGYVNSVDGAILMNGVSGSDNASTGVLVYNGSIVKATGSGSVTLNGTAGNTLASTNHDSRGVDVENTARVQTNSGTLTLNGNNVSVSSAGFRYGINIDGGGTVSSQTGAINLIGTGGAGTTGIALNRWAYTSSGNISSTSGNVLLQSLSGTGIELADSATVSTAGSVSVDAVGGGAIAPTSVSINAGVFTLNNGNWNQVAATLPAFTANDFRIAGGTFIRALGGDGSAATPYQLTDIYGVQGIGSAGVLGKSYVLASDINAAGTTGWNVGAGFMPIGAFAGNMDGAGHTISSLVINRPTLANVGLFGVVNTGAQIKNLGLLGGSVSGTGNVGALAGVNSGAITNSYETGSVSSASASAGGLVGSNAGSVSNSYATGNVSGGGPVTYAGFGGLVGNNAGSISGSYATGNVTGGNGGYMYFAGGGLVGYNPGGSVVNSYATGSVSNMGNAASAGLVGYNGGSVSNSYSTGSAHMGSTASPTNGYGLIGYGNAAVNSFWDMTLSGLPSSSSGTGLTTAQMMQLSSFSSWNTASPNTIANTGGSGAVWRIYEGHTTPLLTSFLKSLGPAVSGLSDVSVTYNGAVQYGSNITSAINGVSGVRASGTNAGFYNGYYSNQQGYDIFGGNLYISAVTLNAISLNGTRVYDGTANVAAGIFTLSGLVSGQDLTLTGSGTVADKNVGVNKPVTLGTLTLGNGTNGLASNYTFTGGTQLATITQLPSVAWTAGASGNWSNAANWAGGAIPDRSNVAAVTIPAGVTVTYDSAVAGTTTLNTLNSSGGLTMAAGALALNSASSVSALGMTGGTLTASGGLTVADYTHTSGTLNVGATTLLKSTGSLAINGAIASAVGGSLTLQAANNIVFGTGASIAATGAPLSVVLNSNSTGTGGGNIQMNTGSSIVSNGGNIALGGGVAGNGTGNATGTALNPEGILLNGATLNAGAGNISLRGTGFAGTTFNDGVHVTTGSVIRTTGAGSITLNGTGGAGTTDNYGVRLGTNSAVSSVDGAISITGQGGAGTGSWNIGIYVHDSAAITSTGAGSITLNGTGGNGTSDNYGVRLSSGMQISSANGDIAITGQGAGTGSSNYGIIDTNSSGAITATGSANITLDGRGVGGAGINSAAIIHGSPSSGNVTLVADTVGGASSIVLSGATISGAGNLLLQPLKPATPIELARSLLTTGAFNLTSAELNTIQPGFSSVVIGRPDGTGMISLGAGAGAGYTFNANTQIQNPGQGSGGIYINEALSTGLKSLTFNSGGSLNVSGAVSAGTFTLSGGTWSQVLATLPGFTVNDFRIAGGTFVRALGGDGGTTPYQLTDIYGVQGMQTRLSDRFVLANDIDAAGTANWNTGAGFAPVGNASNRFAGKLDGQGHTIAGLTINRPNTDYVGLFGYNSYGTIGNIHLGGSVTGNNYVAGLVGYNENDGGTSISNAHASTNVKGNMYVGGVVGYNTWGNVITGAHASGSVTGTGGYAGGLVGYNNGRIEKSYATGNVNGGGDSGGLVGKNNDGNIYYSYATGNVAGPSRVGGLVGNADGGTISDSYATGNVSFSTSWCDCSVSGTEKIGGLVGYNHFGASITRSYASGSVTDLGTGSSGGLVGHYFSGTLTDNFWDTTTTGKLNGLDGTNPGVTGLTSAQMKQFASYGNWNTATPNTIANSGGSGAVWRIYDGSSYPLLRNFLTPLTVSADNMVKAYDGNPVTSLTNASYSVAGAAASGHLSNIGNPYNGAVNVGSYSPGLYSDQQGYDISYVNALLTINPATLSASPISLNGSRVYDGSNIVNANIFSLAGLIGAETLTLTGSGTVADKNVGVNKPVTLGSLALGNGTGLASNYTFTGGKQVATITPAAISAVNGITASNKVYDGNTSATLNIASATLAGAFGGDSVTVSGGTGNFSDKNAGIGKTVNITGLSLVGADAANYAFTLSSTSTKADISKAALSGVSGITASNKVYDGNTSATLNIASATLVGAIGGDSVTVGAATGAFSDKNAGIGKTVNITGLSLGGADAVNYTLSANTATATADIGKAAITGVSGIAINDKVYDGKTAATAVTTGASLAGLVAGDQVTIGTVNAMFDDRNVGVGKTVNLTNLALSGPDAANYTWAGSAASAKGTITVRPLSTWTAAGSGQWSDAGNWDALPDASNVLAVAIPAGVVATYDAGAGSTSVQSLGGAGGFSLSGGSLSIGSGLSTPQYNQSGGSLNLAGSLSVNGSFNQTAGSIAASGPVTITQSAGDLMVGAINAPAISLSAPAGSVGQSAALVTKGLLATQSLGSTLLHDAGNRIGSFKAASTGSGNIELTNVGVIDVQGINTAAGNITLYNTGGISTSGPVVAHGGKVSMTANSPLTIGSAGVLASGDIDLVATDLTSAGNLTLNGDLVSSAGAIGLRAANNFVQNSKVSAALGLVVSAGGSVTLGPSAISFGNPVSYPAQGTSVAAPPGSLTTTSGSAPTDYVVAFVTQFEKAVVAPLLVSVDTLGLIDKDKDKKGTTVEGDICLR